ncbi:MAG TPA: non-canonical purine NTP pyrophosphatase, partial [Kofleriaceae bacterium]
MSGVRLVFATRNPGKVIELRQLLAGLDLDILSAADLAVPEVVEDGDTFLANAAKKALEVSRAAG